MLNGWPMTSKRLTCAALLLAGSSLLFATQGFAQTPHPMAKLASVIGGHGGPGGHGRIRWCAPHFTFHAHDFAHFSVGERSAWVGGRWNHGYHNGRFGWWWFAGGAWYFYDAPIYPYPAYVSDTYVDDDSDGPQGQYWYYCQNPPGYYPYVQRCRMQWQPVPAAAPPGAGYGPQQGPGPGYALRPAPAITDRPLATTDLRREPATARRTTSRLRATRMALLPATSLHRATRAKDKAQDRATRARPAIRPATKIRDRLPAQDRETSPRRRLTIDS